MDCFAALAMTERRGLLRGACQRARVCATRWLAMTERVTPSLRGAPRRSNPSFFSWRHGLLRCARNDGEGVASDSWRSSSHPRFSSLPPDHITPSLRGATATKQSILSCGMDCFAALAMTERHGLLRGACQRARIRATRWLAMTERHGLLRAARHLAALC